MKRLLTIIGLLMISQTALSVVSINPYKKSVLKCGRGGDAWNALKLVVDTTYTRYSEIETNRTMVRPTKKVITIGLEGKQGTSEVNVPSIDETISWEELEKTPFFKERVTSLDGSEYYSERAVQSNKESFPAELVHLKVKAQVGRHNRPDLGLFAIHMGVKLVMPYSLLQDERGFPVQAVIIYYVIDENGGIDPFPAMAATFNCSIEEIML